MNETWAQISDLAFEAALAGYVVALVCYAIELAGKRTAEPTAADTGRMRSTAVGGGTSTLTKTGGFAAGGDRDQIGVVNRATASLGARFGQAAVVVTAVGAAANVLSVVARGLAVGRLPLGNMYEFVSFICAVTTICWLIVLAKTGARTLGTFVMLPVVVLALVAGTKLYVPAAPVVPALNSYWKWIHVTTIAISSSILLVSGAASVLFLIRGRLERKAQATSAASRPGGQPVEFDGAERSGRTRVGSLLGVLPTTATLDRIAYRTAIVGFRCSPSQSSRAPCGPKWPGAGIGVGTPRRPAPSSPGCSTRPICTPGQRRAGAGGGRPGSACSASRPCCSTCSSSTWWFPACTPMPG